jgi:hypothetical protein
MVSKNINNRNRLPIGKREESEKEIYLRAE